MDEPGHLFLDVGLCKVRTHLRAHTTVYIFIVSFVFIGVSIVTALVAIFHHAHASGWEVASILCFMVGISCGCLAMLNRLDSPPKRSEQMMRART